MIGPWRAERSSCLFLSPILSAMGIDPNSAQVVQGTLIALVMMLAGLLALRRRRAE